MNTNEKIRLIRDFEKLEEDIQEQIKLAHPEGFVDNLIFYKNGKGEKVSALIFETDEKIFMVRMSVHRAEQIIAEDDDYDDGNLKDSVFEMYTDKYADNLFEEQDLSDK